MATSADDSQPWDTAIGDELAEIRRRHGEATSPDELVGLAFSGGGIRSATFGLGVLEGLKHFGLLKKVHYLSTVSGGGYIGSWLSANCKRAADLSELNWLDTKADWKKSIDHLRRYSNYLSPDVGFFSADTWSMFTIWIRNTLLIQLTVVLAIGSVLLAPRLLVPIFEHWPEAGHKRWASVVLFIFAIVGIAGNQRQVSSIRETRFLKATNWPGGLALALLLTVTAWIYGRALDFEPFSGGPIDYKAAVPVALLLVAAGYCLQPVAVRLVAAAQLFLAKWRFGVAPTPAEIKEAVDALPTQINYTQGYVQWAVVVPIMITCFLVAAILWGETTRNGALGKIDAFSGFFTIARSYWPFPLSVVFSSVCLLSLCSIRNFRNWKGYAAALLASCVCVLVLHVLLCVIMLMLHNWNALARGGLQRALVWTPALVLIAFSLTIVMLMGMMGRQSTEGVREWWSRLGAWLSIYAVAWMLISVVAVYGPDWVYLLARVHPLKSLAGLGGWAGTVLAGLFAGHSDSTGNDSGPSKKSGVLQVVAEVAPFAFIAGLLVGVATALDLIVTANAGGTTWATIDTADYSRFVTVSIMTLGGCVAALTIMAARIDINEFSLNAFYRSRLVRCYLGATRFRPGERTPQNFTGFDDKDDLPLADLAQPRTAVAPFHIVNCALNLGGSGDLALHTRHSASFTLSALFCGSDYQSRTPSGEAHEIGYVTTSEYGGRFGAPTLGQAISVSGAAASPNMGYNTSPVVAFLLTVFNVRLGWWFPNPIKPGAKFPSPHFNLSYLFAELFGGASDKSKFLMVSDGGHFENLAVYELIKRKCRVIIASDAECDPGLTFDGLGTLIRVALVDFGAVITIDVGSIRPAKGSASSSNRCAVGTILYSNGKVGTLIYLKASMTGHEDTSILQDKSSHPTFPHESTSNQFYSEDQFESYRRLGYEIATRTIGTVISEAFREDGHNMIALSSRLRDTCSPTLDQIGRFTEHSERLMKLWEQLGATPALKGLDQGLIGDSWPQTTSDAFRAEFYTCSEMLQLMENVYLDLNLEETWDHPDNKGWQVMFSTWSKSPAIQRNWQITRGTFGRRFQYFCHRHLSLPTEAEPDGRQDI